MSLWKKILYIILNIHTAKFEFSYLSLDNCSSQFLSHWETLFCSKELSFLSYKNQNKSTIFSSGRENSNCCTYVENYTLEFFPQNRKKVLPSFDFFSWPQKRSLILAGQVLNAYHIIPLRLTYCEIAWPELGQPSRG